MCCRREGRGKFKEAQSRLERGAPVRDARRTVGDWAAQWTRTSLAASSRKDSTKSLYDSLLRTHVIGQPVGAVSLDRLKPTDVEAVIVSLRDRLASSSVYKVFMVLRICLDDAVRDGLLAVNPVQKVKPPAIVSEEVRHLSADEVWCAIHGSPRRPV